MMEGIKKCAHAVGITMGTSGRNSIIEDMRTPGYRLTNDGIAILESVSLADPIEDMGRKVLLEAVGRSNKQSGDGSSTACVLTESVLTEAVKHVDSLSVMDIKRSLEEAAVLTEEYVDKQARPVVKDGVIDMNMLKSVATISAEDDNIGKRIAGIFGEIGPEGIIQWDVSKTGEDHHTIGSGITIEGAKYMSDFICDFDSHGVNTREVRIKNPKIMISSVKVSAAAEFNNISQQLANSGVSDLVVFCEDYDPLLVNDLVATRIQRRFRIVLVKMPTLFKDEWYEDLAAATGATILTSLHHNSVFKATPEKLGTAGNILVTGTDTYIDGVNDMSVRVAALKKDGSDAALVRAARLNTKTARYFVGGDSDSAISYRRYKVEDAIAAAWQSMRGGVVAGGGVALMNVAAELLKHDTVGAKILSSALVAPANHISKNCGFSEPAEFSASIDNVSGLNSRTLKIEPDMFAAGIVDSATIVKNAVRNAVSVAASVVTAETMTLLPKQEVVPQVPMM